MPPRNRAKLGLTVPVDPRRKGFDASYGNNILKSPSTSSSALPSPSRRNIPRSPRTYLPPCPIPPPPPAPTRRISQSSQKKPNSTELGKEAAEKLESLVQGKPSQRKLTKQLSMSEASTMARNMAWEKRKRQTYRKERRRNSISVVTPEMEDPYQALAGEGDQGGELTDADLHDLKGSIELGFGFDEQQGQKLCNTLPALDLYFAVNRKLTPSPVSTPRPSSRSLTRVCSQSSLESLRSDYDSWKICGPGDDPQQVKTKLRHWAQAVACSIIQSS